MSQKLATSSSRDAHIDSLFVALKPLLDEVRGDDVIFETTAVNEAFDIVRARYEGDYERMAAAETVLFGDDIDEFGVQATALFTAWEEDDGGPALPAIVGFAIEKFALDISDPCVRAAFLSAILAEIPNDLQYHGNEHYRKVLFHCIRLITTNNHIFAGTNRVLGKDQIAVLLTASCIHDLGHEGGDNLRDGVYTPGQMEQAAFDAARPFFEALAMPEDQMKDIETIVFCTDITFFAGDNSPCVRMKKIYKHYFWDDDREDVGMMMVGKLRRYEDNPKLILMAMILHEADIATSAGLSYEQTIKETINIMEERGVKTPGPHTVIAFLREQLGETMFTEAGKQLYGKVMADVIVRAEQDKARGRATFYEE